ncbi:IS1/IS1595 family N-terminal zinc-binding domain-containing protein [Thermococcus stetteri]|uniref:IS1/IS1595 family N-terminal zinc-binding domain-containing protein n=1 Tax=Thermococcus stetteri TaxID=49900 RepID=UPI001AEA19B4|nr:transposase [Thermococcus stetteri]MBP1912508.1 transposase-like protein [Thermococcus stetteri]
MTGVITNDIIARRLFLPDPEECYRTIRQIRWPDGVTCPYCDSKNIQKNGHTPKRAQKYHCKNCRKHFNDLTGTIFDHRKFPINEMT